jgi:hypothetical protein
LPSAVGAAIRGSIGALSSAVLGHMSHEAGKPPADAGSIDTRLAPLYPAHSGAF